MMSEHTKIPDGKYCGTRTTSYTGHDMYRLSCSQFQFINLSIKQVDISILHANLFYALFIRHDLVGCI